MSLRSLPSSLPSSCKTATFLHNSSSSSMTNTNNNVIHFNNNNNNNNSNNNNHHHQIYFSSIANDDNDNNDNNDSDDDNNKTLVIPSNLKFDPRATSTPIYGLDKIGGDESNDHDKKKKMNRPNLQTITETLAVGGDVNNETTTASSDTDTDNGKGEMEEDNNGNDDVEEGEDNDDDDDDDNDIDDYEDDIDENIDSETLYSLANKQESTYAIPLPQRLNTPIIDLLSRDEVGSLHLSSSVFGKDPIRTDILHRCVIYQRNKKRGRRNAGAKTKTISEISGSGRKMRNQKGGGVARAGHKRPAHWRGGAKAHGPKGNKQNYETKLNKKVRSLGIKMALSQKLKEGNMVLVNSFEGLESYKTKVLAEALDQLGDIGGRYGCSALVIDHVPEEEEEEEDGTLRAVAGVNVNLQVASGNMHKVKVRSQRFVNVYDLLKYEKLVMSLSALEALEQRYGEED